MENLAKAPAVDVVGAKKTRDKAYWKKGLLIAIFSGFLYGGYTSFMTQGMSTGIWLDIYGEVPSGVAAGVSGFFIVYTVSAIGAACVDLGSAIWSLFYGGLIGRLGDFKRTLSTKPGRILILAAIIGGPLASTAYVIGLQMAGSIIVPIAALNAAIGAIIGKFAFKQKLTGGMILGIIICFAAATLIGSSSMTDLDFTGGAALGCLAAFIAAIGWGIEGAVGGYACCMVDTEIAIIIRQCTSGLVNAVVLVSILTLIGKAVDPMSAADAAVASTDSIAKGFHVLTSCLADFPSFWMLFVAGVFSSWSFKFWYKGASMCGAALGMGCNGAYAFWGPFWCLIVCGFIFGDVETYMIPWQGWVGAIVMVIGILILAISQNKATLQAEE